MVTTCCLKDRLVNYLTLVLMTILFCLIVYGIQPSLIDTLHPSPDHMTIIPFVLLMVVSFCVSEVLAMIHVPPVLGMIVAGILVRNTSDLSFHPFLSSLIRNIALTSILLEGGLGLDIRKVLDSGLTAMSLCFVPLIADIVIMSGLGFWLLDLPIVWSLMLGFIMSAACAAIIVPVMLDCEKRGLGVQKSIPTIVLMAASMDDVTAIAGFGIMLSFAFPSDVIDNQSNWWTYARAPIEVFTGITCGLVFGFLVGVIRPVDSMTRVSLILAGGLASVFFFEGLDFRASGPLSALTLAMFAAHGLRKQGVDVSTLSPAIHVIWGLTSPLFFALIGTEADLRQEFFQSESRLMMCVAVVIVGMVCRVTVTYLSLSFSQLDWKEKGFVSMVWLAKAAVQATVAPIGLDVARQKGLKDETGFGTTIVVVSLIAILLCTPVSVLAVAFLTDKCLKKIPSDIPK